VSTMSHVNYAQHDALRALRLHHYQAMLRLRSYADDADMRKSDSQHYNKRANVHLGFVQTLNEFFPIDDTAERDNDNERVPEVP
jgi:hypothetical protein